MAPVEAAQSEESSTASKVDHKHEIPVSIRLEHENNVVWSQRAGVQEALPGLCKEFDTNGFVILENVLDDALVNALNEQLEQVLRGEYSRGHPPDKQPRLLKSTRETTSENKTKTTSHPLGFSGNLQNVKVLQIINIHKCDAMFRALATCPVLGELVAKLAQWPCGARLAQDQVWAKPPGAAPLVFHKDSPYFMFAPPDVVTVWIALDDMRPEVGPLQYVVSSHRWGNGRVGSANQFFQSNLVSLLESAAKYEGIPLDELQFVSTAGLLAGGISIHNGKTWHGSPPNKSRTDPRRGLGLHFIPAEAKFTKDAEKSRLWKSYLESGNFSDPSQIPLPEQDFPITWQPS